jgi:hypothetical protein
MSVALKPPVRAVGSGQAVLEPRELAGLQHGAEGRRRRLAVVGVAHVEQRPPDDVLRCEPEHSLDPRVDAPHHAVERRDAHHVEGEVNSRATSGADG